MPEDFVDSQLSPEKLSFNDWRIYGHQEWALLAYHNLKKGDTSKAEEAAQKAFAVNPGYGIAAGILMETYIKEQEYSKASYMFELSSKLWPPRHKYLFEQQPR